MVLGIETATTVCGVGIASEDGMVADDRIVREYAHAEVLPQAVERILIHSGVEGGDMDGIAVSIGPGSFTGLRIGLGLAKGLALGWDKPLIAVPTMEGLVKFLSHVCDWACVLLHARKGEVYRGLYRWLEETWKPDGDSGTCPVDEIAEGLPDDEIVFVGEGARRYHSYIESSVSRARWIPEPYSLPSGYAVAAWGRERFLSGQRDDPEALSPLYLKRFQGVG